MTSRRVDTVHVFVATGRFGSFADMRSYIDPEYDEDGDSVPSVFMTEVDLARFEPMCIEAIHRPAAVPVSELLARASYADQWLPLLGETTTADSAVCVFAPNEVRNPNGCSLTYVAAFPYFA